MEVELHPLAEATCWSDYLADLLRFVAQRSRSLHCLFCPGKKPCVSSISCVRSISKARGSARQGGSILSCHHLVRQPTKWASGDRLIRLEAEYQPNGQILAILHPVLPCAVEIQMHLPAYGMSASPNLQVNANPSIGVAGERTVKPPETTLYRIGGTAACSWSNSSCLVPAGMFPEIGSGHLRVPSRSTHP